MNRSWTFGQKLGTGVGAVALLTLLMGAIAIYALQIVVDRKDAVIQNNAQNLIDVERMRAAMEREAASFRAFLLTGDGKYLEAGKSADFIVLDANPLDDITNTRRISAVILRGAAVDRTQPVR